MIHHLLFSESSEFRKFCELSADLGRNPLLVQGAGGNTSIKEDGLLWVKASGTWLSEATEKKTMVAVDLARLQQAMTQMTSVRKSPSILKQIQLNPFVHPLRRWFMLH